MKVIFITPATDIHRNFFYRRAYLTYEPANAITGPLILGRILKDAGHEVEVHEELYKNLNFKRFEDADIIGISTMTTTAPRAFYLADYFRKRGKRVIMGGIHVSALPQEAIQHCDQVVVGEAETVIKDVVEGKIDSPIVHAPKIMNLDTISFPDYDLLKTPVNAINITTSRGCPFSCDFCTTSRMFHPYRERSVENVIEGITRYWEKGHRKINIQDDNFTANKKRVKRILKGMIERGMILKDTFFFGRTDIAEDEELLELLSCTGFKIVLVGIESINQNSLDSINKKQSIEKIMHCTKQLSKYDIKLSASIVLGLDFDTEKDIWETIEYCKEINAYTLQPPPLTAYPGTPLYEKFEREGRIITKEWNYYDMMHVMFRPRHVTPLQLQKIFQKALFHFYTFRSSIYILLTYGFLSALKRIVFAIAIRIAFIYTLISERAYLALLSRFTQYNPGVLAPKEKDENTYPEGERVSLPV